MSFRRSSFTARLQLVPSVADMALFTSHQRLHGFGAARVEGGALKLNRRTNVRLTSSTATRRKLPKVTHVPHVLHVMHAFEPATMYGGIVTWARDVCHEQAAAGLTVSIACMASYGGQAPPPAMRPLNQWRNLSPSLRVKYYGEEVTDRLSTAMLRGLSRDVAEADVVHISGIFYAFFPAAMRAARRAGKPVVVSVHGMLSDWQLEQSALAKRIFLAACVRPIALEVLWHATCQQEADDVARLFPGAHVRLVPNGVDIAAITATAPSTSPADLRAKYLPQAPRTGPVVVAMCRLHYKKGLDLLLYATAQLRRRGRTDLIVLIAGADDGDGESLKTMVSELGLGEVVRFVGQLDGAAKWQLLAGADVFAMPSHDENFGIVYAEALACGTPVLASIHTPWSIVESDRSGRWIDLEVDHISGALDDLLKRDASESADRAQITARRYDWPVIIPQLIELYAVPIPPEGRQR